MGKRAKVKREKKEVILKERKEYVKKLERINNPWENFWRRFDFWIYVACFIMLIAYPIVMKGKIPDGSTAIIHTSMGDINVKLYKNDAPNTVDNFVTLADRQYYNNLLWHRVIKGFVIQAGDPTGTGTGGQSASGTPFADEINPNSLGLSQTQIDTFTKQGYTYNYSLNSHKMVVGSVAMANSGPNTNTSQFFIVTEKDQPSLDGQYTVFGQVTKGLDIAVKISEVKTDSNDKPINPVYIKSIEIF